MRAHLNCVENLPVYAPIVVALMATGVQGPVIDRLAVTMLAARIEQTLAHIALPSTNAAISLRFALFSIQVTCMIHMGTMVTTASLR